MRPSTVSDMNISETSWLFVIKFHLEHRLGRGLTAVGFGLDWSKALVSMQQIATIGFYFNWEKPCDHSNSFIFDLQVMRTTIKSWMGSKFGKIRPWT